MQEFKVNPIGKVHVTEEGMSIELEAQYIAGLRALDGFTHINVVWWFSDNDTEEARKVLETPRPYAKAPEVMGIFATRAPYRPNPIAITIVPVNHIDYDKGIIKVGYIDANDGTPVLDIKPYTPCMDRVENVGVPDWCRHWPSFMEGSATFDWASEFTFM